jgi:ribosomal protein S18 acetylase RimI-like enzyme
MSDILAMEKSKKPKSPSKTQRIEPSDFVELYALWLAAGLELVSPKQEQRDFENILSLEPAGCLKIMEHGKIVAAVLGAYNGRRAWIYHLAVHPDYQKKQYGSKLLHAAEQALIHCGAPKILLGVSVDNTEVVSFYKKNGYTMMNETIVMSKIV